MSLLKNHSYAVSLLFIFNGCLFGSWAAKVPFFQEKLELNEQHLALLLLLLALGAVCSFPLTGKLVDKFGAQYVSKWAYVLYPFPFIGLTIANDITLMGAALFLFGFLHGAMDVSMNSWAARAEAILSKKMMPFFHAMFSLGAGLGAAISVFFVKIEMSTSVHFCLIVLFFIPFFKLLNVPAANVVQHTDSCKTGCEQPLPIVFLSLVGFIAFACALGEGAIADWSAVIMRREFETDMSFAGWAYAIFSLLMVLARLLGFFIIEKIGVVNTVRGCSLFSFVGALLIIFAVSPTLALVGFACLGIGYSVVVPLVFSTAAAVNPNKSGRAIAFVATFAYGGMLIGPVIIGLIAHQTSLRNALVLLAILPIYSLLTAYLLKPKASKVHAY